MPAPTPSALVARQTRNSVHEAILHRLDVVAALVKRPPPIAGDDGPGIDPGRSGASDNERRWPRPCPPWRGSLPTSLKAFRNPASRR